MKSLYLTKQFFLALAAVVLLLVLGYVFSALASVGYLALGLLAALLVLDIFLLYRKKRGLFARRITPEKLSNGDENPIDIYLESRYTIPVWLQVIDELPFQLQQRDLVFRVMLKPGNRKNLNYQVRPVKRGVYHFGAVNVFCRSQIGLIRRRYRFDSDLELPVYPSFVQMRKYELLAISNELSMMGIKKIRRIGNNREFEQIDKYVTGDDYRRINWKATARKTSLMVNHYQDERSQQVISVIDKGRMMKMPFEHMSLLDYAINASLVISNIALRKGDKPGLITFQHRLSSMVPPSSRHRQMQLIMEQLYKEKTHYLESDFKRLYVALRRKLNQRSLILLFTNFESIHSLERQLPYLKMINRQHVLVCLFFENTEIEKLSFKPAENMEEIYAKGIAEQLLYEKRLMVKKLNSNGIYTVLTPPEDLSVNTINKYLEMKARGVV